VDIDGRFTYSQVVAVNTNSTVTSLTIYPTPSVNEATLAINSDKKQSGFYTIYDPAGKKLATKYTLIG
jgi:hypothetical protein